MNDTDEDPELSWRGQEPEAWSVTVDKKVKKTLVNASMGKGLPDAMEHENHE